MIEQFLKFCVVGGSGVFVDFGITYACNILVFLMLLYGMISK